MQKESRNPEHITDDMRSPGQENRMDPTFGEMQQPKPENVLYPTFGEPPKQETMLNRTIDEMQPNNQENNLHPGFGGVARNQNESSSSIGKSKGKKSLVRKRKSRTSNSTSYQIQSRPQYDAAEYQKLENDVHEFGLKMKHHEENIENFKDHVNRLDGEILDAQSKNEREILDAQIAADRVVEGDSANSEDVIINDILKYENTAAALFCQVKYKTAMPEHALVKNVVGVVALLGATDDARLSSILSEYLGLETMLAVVCKTPEDVKALESYSKDGSINKNSGATDTMGISLAGRKVICLDELRRYPVKFIVDDPHRRLDLVKPIIQGKKPTGFLGFAVNMISIDIKDMYCMSKAGNTLRETLFYNLLSSLQVYMSTEDMLKVQPFISNGAVSLDGGMIGKDGVFFTGHKKRDVDVKFPVRPSYSIRSEDYYENGNKIKKATWQKNRVAEDLQREHDLLVHAAYTYESKKGDFFNLVTAPPGV